MPDRLGRKKPYSDAEIRTMRCARCGRPAVHQWQVCADGNRWRPICEKCDVALNRVVLQFMGDPDCDVKVAQYQEAVNA